MNERSVTKAMGKNKFFDIQSRFEDSVRVASQTLANGRLAALPTETVYGLGADVFRSEALEGIFSLKKRPASDPLIVHIFDASWIPRFAALTNDQIPVLKILCKKFWPGPLTLVLESHPEVNPVIRAGGATVALRCPDHPFFLAVLAELNSGIAAPSANVFGHISPTSASDVDLEFPNSELSIFDGGRCRIGIESTVLRVWPNGSVKVLRPGRITETEIFASLGHDQDSQEIQKEKSKTFEDQLGNSHTAAASPGLCLQHYAPRKPTYTLQTSAHFQKISRNSSQHCLSDCILSQAAVVDFGSALKELVTNSISPCRAYFDPSPNGDLEVFTNQLFSTLRTAESHPEVETILIHFPDSVTGLWSAAVRDRIQRASSGKTMMIKDFVPVFV